MDSPAGNRASCDGEIGSDRQRVIVFTADHGETMREHAFWFTHGYHVYEPLALVPLALRVPGRAAARVDAPVSLMDIVPTILEQDPGEEHALPWSSEDEERAASLLGAIARDPDPAGVPRQFVRGLRVDAPKVRPDLEEAEVEKLRALGYVE